jgi:nitrogen fixation/metabolism regulation signal transduction histidine kinase
MHSRPSSRKPTRQSVSFEVRLRIFCTFTALAVIGLAAALLAFLHVSTGPLLATIAILTLVLLLVFAAFIEEAVRPIQTLANVVAALREEDYSFRARGASRDDALGQLSLEINALADTLQAQRVASLEAVALLRRVIAEMDAPVLAFDQDTRLRLLNPAAERVFRLEPARDLGKSAGELTLSNLLGEITEAPAETIIQLETPAPGMRPGPEQSARWMIHRGTFRQRGVPHTLIVLSDVSAALREEERLAWRRLIRVIGHEISNSLTPIKSIAGSLRSRILPPPPRAPIGTPEPIVSLAGPNADPAPPARPGLPETASLTASFQRDLQRGLSVIENRAESLNRFVQAYRQLAQLPAPAVRRVPLVPLLERVISLEIRLDIRFLGAPDVDLLADPDQIEQLLINLVRNAVEAATICLDEDHAPTQLADHDRLIPTDPNIVIPPVVVPGEAEEPGLSDGPERDASRTAPASSRRTATDGCLPEVTIRAVEEGDLVSIAIDDNGPGLANPDNLFVPLYTTKKSGTGVGLALARQIVEAHGGSIDLRNRQGTQGCRAEIRLPVAERTRG